MASPDIGALGKRYIIVGPGAVGSLVTAELVKGGFEVVLVARGAEYDAHTADGVVLRTINGVERHRVPVVRAVAELALEARDVLVFTVKAQDVGALLSEIAWLPVTSSSGEETVAGAILPIVTLQNGLNSEREALRWFAKVYAATGAFTASKEKVGESISHSHPIRGLIWIGAYPAGVNQEIREIAADIGKNGGLGVEPVANIVDWKAWKLIHNTSNGLEPLFAPSANRAEAQEILADEYKAVLAKLGIAGIDPYKDTKLDYSAIHDGGGAVDGRKRIGNSTLQSYIRGSKLETDYLNGEVVLLGRLHGVETPLNAIIQRLIHKLETERLPAGSFPEDVLADILDGLKTRRKAA